MDDRKLASTETPDWHIHKRDIEWILESDFVVAEVSTPSLGVGYEIGRAIENKKHVLCPYRQQTGKRLSAMIAGSPGVTIAEYVTLDDAIKIIDNLFSRV